MALLVKSWKYYCGHFVLNPLPKYRRKILSNYCHYSLLGKKWKDMWSVCTVCMLFHNCVCVCFLEQTICCLKDVVYCVQQLHAGSFTAPMMFIIHNLFSSSSSVSVRHTALYSWQNHPVSLVVFFVAVTMFPRVILKGTMIKKSQQKKRISPSNYKERFFVLDTQDLKYSERRPGVSSHKNLLLLAFYSFMWLLEHVLAEKAHGERLHTTVQY